MKMQKQHSSYSRTGGKVDGQVRQVNTGLFDISIVDSNFVRKVEKGKLYEVKVMFFRTTFGDSVVKNNSLRKAQKNEVVSTGYSNRDEAIKELKNDFEFKSRIGEARTEINNCDLKNNKSVVKKIELVFSEKKEEDKFSLRQFSGVFGSNSISFTLIETKDIGAEVNSVAFSSEGFLAVGSGDNNTYVYDTSTFSLQETLSDSTNVVDSVAFSGEGFLAAGSDDDNVYVYDTSTFSLQETLTGSTNSVESVAFSGEGFLAAGSDDNNTYVYDTSTFSLQETLTDSASVVYSVAFSGEGFLALGSGDDNTYVYDTSTFSLQETLTPSTNSVLDVTFSSEGFLAVGSGDNVYVYDTSTFSLQETLTASASGVYSVAFSSQGYLALGSGDDNVYVYDTSTFSLQETLSDSASAVYSVAFSGEGYLALGNFYNSKDDVGGKAYVYQSDSLVAAPDLGSVVQTSNGVKQTDGSAVIQTQA